MLGGALVTHGLMRLQGALPGSFTKLPGGLLLCCVTSHRLAGIKRWDLPEKETVNSLPVTDLRSDTIHFCH